MSPLSARGQSFPHLAKLLGNLRSGLKQFGYSEIEDLLRGRRDREFNRKIRDRSLLLGDAIREIQTKDRKHSHDPGQIKYLLWKRISQAIRVNAKDAWDAENIGQSIVVEQREGLTRVAAETSFVKSKRHMWKLRSDDNGS